jgi:hypothetical protein
MGPDEALTWATLSKLQSPARAISCVAVAIAPLLVWYPATARCEYTCPASLRYASTGPSRSIYAQRERDKDGGCQQGLMASVTLSPDVLYPHEDPS